MESFIRWFQPLDIGFRMWNWDFLIDKLFKVVNGGNLGATGLNILHIWEPVRAVKWVSQPQRIAKSAAALAIQLQVHMCFSLLMDLKIDPSTLNSQHVYPISSTFLIGSHTWFLQIKRHGLRVGVAQEKNEAWESLVSGSFFQVLTNVQMVKISQLNLMFSGNPGLGIQCRNLTPAVPKAKWMDMQHCRLWNVPESNRLCRWCDKRHAIKNYHLGDGYENPVCDDFWDGLFFIIGFTT